MKNCMSFASVALSSFLLCSIVHGSESLGISTIFESSGPMIRSGLDSTDSAPLTRGLSKRGEDLQESKLIRTYEISFEGKVELGGGSPDHKFRLDDDGALFLSIKGADGYSYVNVYELKDSKKVLVKAWPEKPTPPLKLDMFELRNTNLAPEVSELAALATAEEISNVDLLELQRLAFLGDRQLIEVQKLVASIRKWVDEKNAMKDASDLPTQEDWNRELSQLFTDRNNLYAKISSVQIEFLQKSSENKARINEVFTKLREKTMQEIGRVSALKDQYSKEELKGKVPAKVKDQTFELFSFPKERRVFVIEAGFRTLGEDPKPVGTVHTGTIVTDTYRKSEKAQLQLTGGVYYFSRRVPTYVNRPVRDSLGNPVTVGGRQVYTVDSVNGGESVVAGSLNALYHFYFGDDTFASRAGNLTNLDSTGRLGFTVGFNASIGGTDNSSSSFAALVGLTAFFGESQSFSLTTGIAFRSVPVLDGIALGDQVFDATPATRNKIQNTLFIGINIKV